MIEKQYGKIIFICDTCEDDLDTDTKDFMFAVDVMKADGWVAIKDDDKWVHLCRKCKQGL